MLAATLMATYALYTVASKSQARTDNRAQGLIQQQIGFERMSRELRQATTITPVSSQAIDVTTWVRPFNADRSVKRRVRYECATTCQRWEGPENGALTSGPVPVDQQRPEPGRLHADAEHHQSDIRRLPGGGERQGRCEADRLRRGICSAQPAGGMTR